MRTIVFLLFILIAAQLPEQPVAAQPSQTVLESQFERARAGDKAAQFSLGTRYRTGRGVAKSDTEAVKWLRRAAEQGYAPAQILLGSSYKHGLGVPKDLIQAYMWYALAGALRDTESLEPRMTGPQIAEAKRRAADWKRAHEKR